MTLIFAVFHSATVPQFRLKSEDANRTNYGRRFSGMILQKLKGQRLALSKVATFISILQQKSCRWFYWLSHVCTTARMRRKWSSKRFKTDHICMKVTIYKRMTFNDEVLVIGWELFLFKKEVKIGFVAKRLYCVY